VDEALSLVAVHSAALCDGDAGSASGGVGEVGGAGDVGRRCGQAWGDAGHAGAASCLRGRKMRPRAAAVHDWEASGRQGKDGSRECRESGESDRHAGNTGVGMAEMARPDMVTTVRIQDGRRVYLRPHLSGDASEESHVLSCRHRRPPSVPWVDGEGGPGWRCADRQQVRG
jgi:hypothetical protein